MSNKEKILFSLILFFLLALFFPRLQLLNVIATAGLVIYAFIFTSFKQKWMAIKERKHLQAMILFFAWIMLSVALSANSDKALSFLDPRLPLLYMPLSIGVLYLSKKFRHSVMISFATITTLVCAFCLAWNIYPAYTQHNTALLYNDSLTHVIGHQSIYISLLVNISIFIFAKEIFSGAAKYKGGMLVAVIFLFGISYLLASRTMMGLLYVVTLAFIFYYIFKRKKYLEGLTLIMGLLIGIFMVYKFVPKTFNRFKELTYTNFDFKNMGAESHYNMKVTEDQWNGANFRLAAWQCGWEVFKQSPIIGVGIGDKFDDLIKKYEEKGFQFAIVTKKNVHNNYLDILYSMGIIGLMLFSMAWIILPLIHAKQNHDWLTILIILTFATAWITEIYFDRSLGGMLTGFFFTFLLTYEKKELN
jgi:O-antigen ligase